MQRQKYLDTPFTVSQMSPFSPPKCFRSGPTLRGIANLKPSIELYFFLS